MGHLTPAAVLASVVVVMLLEHHRSRANERALRAGGAVEPAGDVFPLMQVAYPACFVATAVEGWIREAGVGTWFWAGAIVFVAAKALKYWAVFTLGPRWTFRVLVLPGAPLVAHGPYRVLKHPNYAAVVGELAGVALMMTAPIAGAIAVVGFGWIMLRRIAIEERALGMHAD